MPKPPTLRQVGHIDVFVSSTSEPEAQYLRTEVDEIARKINLSLRESGRGLYLDVFHWYQVPPQKAKRGKVNRIFVERALTSHLVLALLVRYVRAGTKEEIKAAHSSKVPLSVLYFPPSGERKNSVKKLRKFIGWLEKRSLYVNAGDPYEAGAVDALRDVLLHLAFSHSPEQVAYERR